MNASRRQFLSTVAIGAAAYGCSGSGPSVEDDGVKRYVRFERGGEIAYGLLRGDRIELIEGELFGDHRPAGSFVPLGEAKLLYPCKPTKILALAGNYMSHLAEGAQPHPHPEPFYKTTNSIIGPDDKIVYPPGSRDVHYEAEFVIVIGKRAKKVSEAEAEQYIFGYTAGNDISERNWQNGSLDGPESKDLQWWRGKGADTFSPVGPVIAVGLDYLPSRIQSRVNGEVRQDTTLDHLIHKPPVIVSFISQYVTLLPGDLIFTGTTGKTLPMQSGDVVEVEIDGIGVLRNPIA
jgi:2-keto-4-pentenoate hydratase/2-oxohepta-3-ene-1,7-dioic acid hydratase in catechol pathway